MSRKRKSRRLYLRDAAVPEITLNDNYYNPSVRFVVRNKNSRDTKAAIFELTQWQVKHMLYNLRKACGSAAERMQQEAQTWTDTVP